MGMSILVSLSGDGWRNLAVEDYLMDHLGPDDAVIYFFVNENAVIIGRNQNPWAECRLGQMEADGVQLVRRTSGGGAVYHDRGNLNYSFVMGSEHYDLHKQLELILTSVRAMGIPCEFSGRNDILADGRKFSGTAFCDRGKVKLHHGTLLVNADLEKLQRYLNVDASKLASKGIRSVRSRVCNLNEFNPDISVSIMLNELTNACKNAYDCCNRIGMDDIESEELERYVAKHSSDEWRLGKTPRFDYEAACRFPWGSVQLLLRLKGGIVESLDVYSDANDVLLAEQIGDRLQGTAFNSSALAHALRNTGDSRLDELAGYLMTLDL